MKKHLNNNGTIVVIFVILLSVLATILLVVSSAALYNRVSIERSYNNNIALNIAEAGIEKAIWELKANGTYAGETATVLGDGEYDITITDEGGNVKSIVSIAYVPTKANPKYKKAVKVKITDEPTIADIAFNYAIQAGAGGIDVGGSSDVDGNLYSNGDIVVSGNAKVEKPGNVWAVGTITDNGGIAGTQTEGVDPISLPEIDIDMWKGLAQAGGTISGNYSPPKDGYYTDLGPTEITGDMTMSNSSQKINLKGPLYIHGDLNISGGFWELDESFGENSTIVIVDGTIDVSGAAEFLENTEGGYVLFISLSTNNTKNSPAIKYVGHAEGEKLALYAYNGSMSLGGHGEIVAMTGQTLYIYGDGEIDYEDGLATTLFAGGPGGTWVVLEWQEISPP